MRAWLCRMVELGALLYSFAAYGQAAAPVSLEAFFSPAKMQDVELSPSGRWMAALTSEAKTRVGILIVDLEGKESTRLIVAGERDDVSWFTWVSDDWLVFSVDDPNDRSVHGQGAGLMSTSRDGKTSRMLVSRRWNQPIDPTFKRRTLEPNHYFAARGAVGTNEVIVVERNYDVNYEYSHSTLKILDVTTGAARTMLAGAPRADSWWFDGQGRARVASYQAGNEITVYWADSKTGAWREISRSPSFERPFVPSHVEGEDRLIVRTDDGEGNLELREFDFATLRPRPDTLLKTPGFNSPITPLRDRGSNQLLGLHVLVDARTTVWYSPAMRDLQARADAKFPNRVNLLECKPCENARAVLIYSYADTDPGMFVLYRPQEDKWQLVGQVRPDIEPSRMAGLELHRIKARDGLDLPVWITRPHGPPPNGAPAVVLVHGGPWSRGTEWEWNPEAQFLASRGYVVIEPEFRGSLGYGYKHLRAGFRQWGQAMQDDVTDALRFAIQQGWVDASRVCIMGASYGGYSTLAGLMKDPDQYRCGVAFAALADPRFMFDFHWSDISSAAKEFSLPVRMGDRKADDAMFAANSPLEHADRIKAPLLLAHGGIDRRVPIQNGERMRDALRKFGREVEWVLYPDEEHGFAHPENKLDYYRRVEVFLAKHLKKLPGAAISAAP